MQRSWHHPRSLITTSTTQKSCLLGTVHTEGLVSVGTLCRLVVSGFNTQEEEAVIVFLCTHWPVSHKASHSDSWGKLLWPIWVMSLPIYYGPIGLRVLDWTLLVSKYTIIQYFTHLELPPFLTGKHLCSSRWTFAWTELAEVLCTSSHLLWTHMCNCPEVSKIIVSLQSSIRKLYQGTVQDFVGLFLLSLHVSSFLIPVLMIYADSQIKTDHVMQYGHASSTPYC